MIARQRRAPFTNAMVGLNVVAFVWLALTGGWNNLNSLLAHGALYGPAVLAGQWWRIITGAFLHGGIPHIALNMIALYQVGRLVEMLLGSLRTAILYFIAMIGSGIAVVIFAPTEVTVGASGAIFGLFGALVAIGLRLGSPGRSLVMQTVPIIAINLAFGFLVPNISNAGHLGGLICGFAAGLAVAYSIRLRRAPIAQPADGLSGDPRPSEPPAVGPPA
ncbi:MAG: rhomboid family intramembrane serine protease [Vulcanimicrobiaceae bacterium]